MTITIADQYYLKAMDEYPYCLEDTIENLNYALSYNNEHSGANRLMGKLYMEQFQNFELAEEYFQAAISSDPYNLQTCENYSWLMIKTRKFREALRLIKYSYNLKGVDLPQTIRLEALVYELIKDYTKAKELLLSAMEESYDSNYLSFLESELKRIETKKSKVSRLNYNFI